MVLLADRRVSPYLPASLRVLPADSLRALPARQAEDCDMTCRWAVLGSPSRGTTTYRHCCAAALPVVWWVGVMGT